MSSIMTAVYGPVSSRPEDVASSILDLFAKEWTGHLESYYARVRFDSDEGSYTFFDETMTLAGKNDLLDRIRNQRSGRFTCETDLGFAPSAIHVAIFTGPLANDGTTIVATFEKELTNYLFTSEVTAVPFALCLERLALAIGSECYLAAPDYDRWLPLPPSMLLKRETFDNSTQFVGWRDGVVDGAQVLAAMGAEPGWMLKTLNGFDIVPLMGKPRPIGRSIESP
jgi:hypothetical protein